MRLTQWFSGKESAGDEGDLKKMWVQSLGWDDPLEYKMATYTSIQYSCLENSMDS